MLYIHVTLVPIIGVVGELKTKPTQHSVAELREIGIQPDIIVARSEEPLSQGIREKIALFCDVDPDAVVSASDADDIYRVPLNMHRENLDDLVVTHAGPRRAGRPISPSGTPSSSASTPATGRSRSPWWASTCSCTRPTSRCGRR